MLVFGGVGHLEEVPQPDPYGTKTITMVFSTISWDVLLQVAEVTTNGHMFVPRVSSSFPAVSKVRIVFFSVCG